MNILLITPSRDPELKKPRALMLPTLALPILEALTPKQHHVKIVMEDFEHVDLDAECDLVGISCMTTNALRAYSLAREFRDRGKVVILGGIHPTMMPDEALRHADAVVIGEAEEVWESVLTDVENKCLKRRYSQPHPALDRYLPIRFHTIKGGVFGMIPLMTTRGCPYNCEFCSVHAVFGRQIRHYPIENIMKSIAESKGKRFFFLDDNIVGDPRYARELFNQLIPLKIRWIGQASIRLAKDKELLSLAAESGCVGLLFGLESVSEEQISQYPKLIKSKGELEDAIRTIRTAGIHFFPSFVFGFDKDKKSIFSETLEFMHKNKIGTANLCMLTPYPGTAVYNQFVKENRLLTTDWSSYDMATAVYEPMNMSAEQLQIGAMWIKYQFTKTERILKKLPANSAHPLAYLATAFSYRKFCRAQIKSGKYRVTRKQLARNQPF